MTEQRAVRLYAHMCRMDHEQIGHNDSEHEQCPLCRIQAERDALSTELAEAKAEIERMRETLEHFAMLPLEEFGFDEKPDERPITGFNKWQLTVGHIRKARAALIPAKEKP